MPAERATLPKDFVSLADWPREGLERLLVRASELKELRSRRHPVRTLEGSSIYLYFEKPSLRTLVTFQVGAAELGAYPVYHPEALGQIGRRESVEDVARNLSRWCHAIVVRAFAEAMVDTLARAATIPVINALTDLLHPCQAMADALTIREHGDLGRDRVVYLGDGNNVANSLIELAGCFGMRLTVCTPPGREPDAAIVRRAQELARGSGADLRLEADPRAAVKDAAFVYTDVWTSMGQEAEAEERRAAFAAYQVNAALLRHAPAGVRILHCLPAHRGEEITAEVLDSERSLVFEQAENRLHAQKAILETLIHRWT